MRSNTHRGTHQGNNKLPSDLKNPEKQVFFIALVKWELSRLDMEARYNLIMEINNSSRNYGTAYSNLNCNKSDSKDIISLVSAMKNIKTIESALIIAEYLGIKSEFCFHTFPVKGREIDLVPKFVLLHEHIPESIEYFEKKFSLQLIDYIHDFTGIKEQAICMYSCKNSNNIFVIANRIFVNDKPMLKIGRSSVPAHFYSRVRIDKSPYFPVILCVDMLLASKFRSHAREARLLERTNCIISGFFGGDNAIECLNFSELIGHPVVIIPRDYTLSGLKDVVDIAMRCKKAGVSDVKIYPWPIIALPESSFQIPIINTEWEKLLWEQIKFLDSCELLSVFTDQILREAIIFTDYENWMIHIGLINAQNGLASQINNVSQALMFFDDIPNANERSGSPTWDDLVCQQYTTLIWGPSNSGKTWVGLQLAISLASGFKAFGLSSASKRAVCYMDGEVGADNFKKRCNQLLDSSGQRAKFVSKNLTYLSPSSDINILDEISATNVIKSISEKNVQILIIDNLLSLASNAVKSSVDKLFSFVRQLKDAGIAVIILHHSGKDGKTHKGPVDLVSLSQNVIRLEGKDQLLDQENLSNELNAACNSSGPVMRMTFDKCKFDPELERKPATYHIPKDCEFVLIEGGWKDTASSMFLCKEAGDVDSPYKVIDDDLISEISILSPDDEKVLSAFCGRKYKRTELGEKTKFKKDKLLKTLNKLKSLDKIKQYGKGRGTYYEAIAY